MQMTFSNSKGINFVHFPIQTVWFAQRLPCGKLKGGTVSYMPPEQAMGGELILSEYRDVHG